jgi:ribosomal protein L3 glutamine methyltransferase
VSAAAIANFPPEHRAEPILAHAGGEDGLDIVRRILAGAGSHLTESGTLVVEIGTGRALLEGHFPHLDLLWLDTETSVGEVFAVTAEALAAKPARSRKARK